MDKAILVQYCEMREEIKDIRRRISELEKGISKLGIVSDSVKGTRKDGTYGSIRITGYPTPDYYRRKVLLDKYSIKLVQVEEELLELSLQAEEYIESIERSELRMILRFCVIDNLSNTKIAERMNVAFPKRRVKYTDENIKKRIQRFFEKV